MMTLAEIRNILHELSNQTARINQFFPTIDAADNGTMTAEQRTAMRVKLAQAEELIDQVRKQLFDAQK